MREGEEGPLAKQKTQWKPTSSSRGSLSAFKYSVFVSHASVAGVRRMGGGSV